MSPEAILGRQQRTGGVLLWVLLVVGQRHAAIVVSTIAAVPAAPDALPRESGMPTTGGALYDEAMALQRFSMLDARAGASEAAGASR